MGDGATLEDVIANRDEEPLQQKEYIKAVSGEISQLGVNPLSKIDFAKAEALNNSSYKERKVTKRVYELKKVFLRYAKKYALKWDAVMNYPKQIKQKPAWFDLALSMFKDNEISTSDKKVIRNAFNMLWEFRDRMEPERVMDEEESLRQYGINSPYYQQPETSADMGGLLPSEEMSPTDVLLPSQPDTDYTPPATIIEPTYQQPSTSMLGVRKVAPQNDEDFLSGMGGFKSNIVDMTPLSRNKGLPKPQGNFPVGLTPSIKKSSAGGGAFDIGRNLFSTYSSGAVKTPQMNLPSQPVQVRPDETITVAPQPQIAQRKQRKSKSVVGRSPRKVSSGLSKFRMIELPTIPKQKMSVALKPKVKSIKSTNLKKSNNMRIQELSDMNMAFGNAKSSGSKIKISNKIGKGSVGNMSRDIKSSVNGVVGGIRNLKSQVRGEFRTNESLKDFNLKNIKSNKVKTNKNLNVLNKLKSEAHLQMSREALECKMIPKLREQCDRVFTKNHVTNEVSKFRNEFKDISKAVPTVRGEKARLVEVGIIGGSITHGVEGAHVNDVKKMFKNSGSTKQMNVGMVEYDYSFATGAKRKIKTPPIVEEYYEYEGDE